MDQQSRNPSLRPLVLMVDGHEDGRAWFSLALSAMGFDVVTASDGAEAYGCALKIHPDIVLTDLPVPNYDGWRFLHDLKQNPHTARIPVVAMSDHVERSIREYAGQDGFAAFFAKPVPPFELAAGLHQVLDGDARAGRQ